MLVPEVEYSSIDPLVPEYYLRQLLVTSTDIAAFCGNRIAFAKDGFDWSQFNGATDADNWPFILVFPAEDALQEMYADQFSTIEHAVYAVRCYMREDFLPADSGIEVEDFNAIGRKAIDAALQRWAPKAIEDTDSLGNPVSGYVTGLQILKPVYRTLTGEKGRKQSEMGRTVLITFA